MGESEKSWGRSGCGISRYVRVKWRNYERTLKRARESRDLLHKEQKETQRQNNEEKRQKDAEIIGLKEQLERANQQIEGLKKRNSARNRESLLSHIS